MTASNQHSMEDFDVANAAQGLRGCDAVRPHDEFRAYEGLHRWAELLIEDRARLVEQLEAAQRQLRSHNANGYSWKDRAEGAEARIEELESSLTRCREWLREGELLASYLDRDSIPAKERP